MSFIPSFLFVLLCLCMHSCMARHFGFVNKVSEGSDGGAVINREPEMESMKIVRPSSGQVPVKHLVSVSNWCVPRNNSNTNHGLIYSDYSMPKMRGEFFKSSSLVVALNPPNIEGSARRGLEVIDYEPPHRNSPIHNRKSI